MEKINTKILVIGGNGLVGKYLLKHLCPHYEVSALLRSAPKFDPKLYPTLKILEGDASNQEALNHASVGIDVIVSSYQNYQAGPNDMHDYVNRLIISMQKNKVPRVIFVAGYGLLKTVDGPRLKDTQKFPKQYLAANGDSYNGLISIEKTDLSFTYVCNPWIKEEDYDGQYNEFEVLPNEAKWEGKAGNIAAFIDQEIVQKKYERKLVGLCNK